MIIKFFNLNDLKESKSNFFLFYGENEGQKDEVIYNIFLKDFNGEVVKYDENQILENNDIFLETCLFYFLIGDSTRRIHLQSHPQFRIFAVQR